MLPAASIWFMKPEDAPADPVHFLAHVMTYGAVEDLKALQEFVEKDDFCEVLDSAPPGTFDSARGLTGI